MCVCRYAMCVWARFDVYLYSTVYFVIQTVCVWSKRKKKEKNAVV